MRAAVLVSSFPELSEKFIVNQIAGLLDLGVDVDILASMPAQNAVGHELVLRYGLAGRTVYAGMPRSLRKRLAHLPALMAANLRDSPLAALRSLSPRYSTASLSLKNPYFLRALRGRRYDVLHCHFGPNGLVGAFLKECGFAKRLVVSFHGSDINSYPDRYGRRVYREMYRAADAVTAGSRFIAAKIAANGCAPEKIRILPVGVRMDEHPPLAFANRSARTILSVGRLVEVKGFRYGVEAFAAVRKEFPEAEYLIVGQGSGSAELLSLARELGVAEGLKLLGPQSGERVAELYGRASVFVLPSIRARDGAEEGQGLVLQEAQASGLPVVSTLVGGIPEGVREGETGFLVPQKDPDALADRIRRLLGDADLRERMGRSARAFAEGNYDMRVLSARLLGIYEAALAISS